MDKISFLIPCYNSSMTIQFVVEEIIEVMKLNTLYEFEIIAINDASPDKVIDILQKIAFEYDYFKVIDLAKNVGKHGALMAGFRCANGDIVVSVDDDQQCPIDKLWELLEPMNHHADVVIANYEKKSQSIIKNFGSKFNSFIAYHLLDKPRSLQLTNFFAMRKFVVDEIVNYTNPYPYIDGLMLRTTKNVINVPMNDRPREIGTSNYTLKKSIQLFLNGFTAFSVKPLRIASVMGVLCAMSGFLFGLYVIFSRIANPEMVAGYSSLMAAMLFIGGMIMMLLGLIGEYIGRIYISLNNAPQYVIRETINLDTDEE